MGRREQGPPSSKNVASGLGRGILGSLIDEGKTWLRFALGGAVIGALGLGGAAGWFIGLDAVLVATAIGTVVGGVGAWLLYLFAASEL